MSKFEPPQSYASEEFVDSLGRRVAKHTDRVVTHDDGSIMSYGHNEFLDEHGLIIPWVRMIQHRTNY